MSRKKTHKPILTIAQEEKIRLIGRKKKPTLAIVSESIRSQLHRAGKLPLRVKVHCASANWPDRDPFIWVAALNPEVAERQIQKAVKDEAQLQRHIYPTDKTINEEEPCWATYEPFALSRLKLNPIELKKLAEDGYVFFYF